MRNNVNSVWTGKFRGSFAMVGGDPMEKVGTSVRGTRVFDKRFLSLSLWSGFYQKLSFFEQNTERMGVGGGNSTRKLVHSIHLHAFHVYDIRLDFHLEFKTRFTQTPIIIMSLKLGHIIFKVIIDSFQKFEDLEIFLENVVCTKSELQNI